jgi:prophage regulatory protein
MTTLDPGLKHAIVDAVAHALAPHLTGKGITIVNPCAPGEDRLLKLRETRLVCGLSTSEIYRQMDRKEFPRPVRVTKKAVAWRMSDLQKWLATLE